MKAKRGLAVLAATFIVVLLGGVALARVGFIGSLDRESDAPSLAADGGYDEPIDELGDEIYDNEGDDPDGEEPKDEEPIADEPNHEEPIADEPNHEEPIADEPNHEEPIADEPKDEEPAHELDLVILSPKNGSVTDDHVITFEGKTSPDATVTWSRYEADINDDGIWWITLKLEAGKNVMSFRASTPDGQVAEASVILYYEVPDTKFSAHQKWEAVDGTPAKNVYYGTAKPGTLVSIVSEFGSKKVEANDNGQWETWVAFEPPCNEAFKVVVENVGGRAEFHMKWFCGEEETNEFTANQKFGSCGEPVPYDIFWGTATPGARIWVESPYGGGVTYTGEGGHWEIRVEFPEAPAGKVFEVAVEAEGGGFKVFTFVANPEE